MTDYVQTVVAVFVIVWITLSIGLSLSALAYDALARRFGWKREQR